jgi:uncharacterized protein
MFIGREKELKTLNDLYKTNKFQFVVLYGRRRIGKTELIKKFIKDKEAIYFVGIESNEKQNLSNLSKSIFDFENKNLISSNFESFQNALEYIFQLSKKKRIILAIDEYPYFARSSKNIPSTIQYLIDKYKEESNLMLILSGSSMSYMEDEVLAYKSPLYGRRTAQIKLQPFSFFECAKYLTNFNDEEKAIIYGMLGGTPHYLMQIDNNLSLEENIKKIFLNSDSFVFEEPINLLKQEVREPNIYNAIINAIALGASKLIEISSKIGETTAATATYIKNLINLGILIKETPYGDDSSKKAIYSISDNMFRFWYRFVLPNVSLINLGAIDIVYDSIKNDLSIYMGQIFENICIQYLYKELIKGNAPINFKSLGRWWGNDKVFKKETEIDIVGTSDSNNALFAECKWTNEKVSIDVLNLLIHRSELFNYKNKYLYIFSKSGFENECFLKAKKFNNIKLITYQEMMMYL